MTVVVGVDNSPASRAALELAAQEARWRQAPLVAVSAFEPPLGTAVGGYPAAAMHTEGERKATAESELRAAVDETLGGQGIQADLRVSAGLAGRVIIETARQTNAQLVVLAAHPARSVLPGTVSQYVLLKARCPVTIVPAEDKEDEQDSGARSSQASRSGRRLSRHHEAARTAQRSSSSIMSRKWIVAFSMSACLLRPARTSAASTPHRCTCLKSP